MFSASSGLSARARQHNPQPSRRVAKMPSDFARGKNVAGKSFSVSPLAEPSCVHYEAGRVLTLLGF